MLLDPAASAIRDAGNGTGGTIYLYRRRTVEIANLGRARSSQARRFNVGEGRRIWEQRFIRAPQPRGPLSYRIGETEQSVSPRVGRNEGCALLRDQARNGRA